MKKILLLTAIACSLLSSCNNNKNSQIVPEPEVVQQTTNVEGVQYFPFDNFELIAIQDTKTTMSAELFKDDISTSQLDMLMPTGAAEASVNVFILKKEGKTILFDAGNGSTRGGMLLDKLTAANLKPEDIDYVFLTHFHPDHTGGMINGETAVFPNAEIYFSNAEKEFCSPEKSDFNSLLTTKMVEAYENRCHAFHFGDTLICGIVAHDATGHTPGHTVFEIDNLLIVGDLLHAESVQIEHPEYCAKYDNDKKKAVETRLKYYKYASENKKSVAAMHLPFPGIIDDFSTVWDGQSTQK